MYVVCRTHVQRFTLCHLICQLELIGTIVYIVHEAMAIGVVIGMRTRPEYCFVNCLYVGLIWRVLYTSVLPLFVNTSTYVFTADLHLMFVIKHFGM